MSRQYFRSGGHDQQVQPSAVGEFIASGGGPCVLTGGVGEGHIWGYLLGVIEFVPPNMPPFVVNVNDFLRIAKNDHDSEESQPGLLS